MSKWKGQRSTGPFFTPSGETIPQFATGLTRLLQTNPASSMVV
jgi:hypothetical protein